MFLLLGMLLMTEAQVLHRILRGVDPQVPSYKWPEIGRKFKNKIKIQNNVGSK